MQYCYQYANGTTGSADDFGFDVTCLARQLNIVTNLAHGIILHLNFSDTDGALLEFNLEHML